MNLKLHFLQEKLVPEDSSHTRWHMQDKNASKPRQSFQGSILHQEMQCRLELVHTTPLAVLGIYPKYHLSTSTLPFSHPGSLGNYNTVNITIE